MRVVRATTVTVALALVAVAAGCASMRAKPKAMVSREGALTRSETLQYVGVDFTRTAFFDPYFRYDDVAHGKVPSWNQHALDDVSAKFPMPVSPDLATSEQRNKKVSEKQFPTSAPDAAKWALTDSAVQQEIAPYVDKHRSGHALLIVAEQLSKPVGVVAHYVVFDRATGQVVLLDQMTVEASGFGIHNYYLNGLKDVANHARKSIESIAR